MDVKILHSRRSIRRVSLFALFLAAMMSWSCSPSVAVGSPAPDIALTYASDGHTIQLSSLRGHVVVLEFWATWCGPCHELMPYLESIGSDFASKGVVVLGISDESRSTIQKFVAENGLTYPAIVDDGNHANQTYAVTGFPTVIVIGSTGKIIFSQAGVNEYVPNEIREVVQAAVNHPNWVPKT